MRLGREHGLLLQHLLTALLVLLFPCFGFMIH